MDAETFQKGAKTIKGFWPEDKIISDEPNKLVIQCENGTYLIYRRMELPDDLKDSPAYKMMHGKVMLQFTEDLSEDTYNNISAELAGKREAKGRVFEALQEFKKRVIISSILES